MIHPKTLLISRHFYSLESYVWRLIYNLKIDTISMYDIPLDRSFLKLWNGIRHIMPSTDRRLELKEKTSMARTVWQPVVYAKGLIQNKYCPELHLVGLIYTRCGNKEFYLYNPLAYTNACQAFWAIDVFSFNSSLLSVDGMSCLIPFQSVRNDLSNGISYIENVSMFRL